MSECSVHGCDGKAKSKGWCQAHYMRWYTTGDVKAGEPVVRRTRGRRCSLDGCDRPHQGRGYCDTHLQRFVKYGDPGPAEIEPRRPGALCSIDGCDKPTAGKGWCNAHYLRWRTTGDPLTPIVPYQWKGRDASYVSIHNRIRKAKGPARDQQCQHCGGQANHWAYDHSDPDARYDDLGRPYSADMFRYFPLCHSCHKKYDLSHK